MSKLVGKVGFELFADHSSAKKGGEIRSDAHGRETTAKRAFDTAQRGGLQGIWQRGGRHKTRCLYLIINHQIVEFQAFLEPAISFGHPIAPAAAALRPGNWFNTFLSLWFLLSPFTFHWSTEASETSRTWSPSPSSTPPGPPSRWTFPPSIRRR